MIIKLKNKGWSSGFKLPLLFFSFLFFFLKVYWREQGPAKGKGKISWKPNNRRSSQKKKTPSTSCIHCIHHTTTTTTSCTHIYLPVDCTNWYISGNSKKHQHLQTQPRPSLPNKRFLPQSLSKTACALLFLTCLHLKKKKQLKVTDELCTSNQDALNLLIINCEDSGLVRNPQESHPFNTSKKREKASSFDRK
jgi:hypothetical protein